jgi:maleylpyruvate isomerase
MEDVERAREVAAAAAERSGRLVGLLGDLDPGELDAPSQLPGWSRLTIVCHLRYGTRALLRMTRDALAGRETSYYPEGRATQRPGTLLPSPGEPSDSVVDDLRSAAAELDREWSARAHEQWNAPVTEPADNPDLGPVPLARLALARLTEVDVHGTDLGIGAPDWSSTLVEVGLPTRLGWLAVRRPSRQASDGAISGSWRLDAGEGLSWLVALDGNSVISRPAVGADETTAVISGSGRDLLALLLGRPLLHELRFFGDQAFAQSFQRAFPGP